MGRGARHYDPAGRRPRRFYSELVIGRTPLGIEREIEAHGIFPRLTEAEAQRAAKGYAPIDNFGQHVDFTNYASYAEHVQQADVELERERVAGYLSTGTKKDIEDVANGALEPSRVGVIVKSKSGTTKVRLIHDLSRSGVNHRIKVPERVILPRLSDVIEGAIVVLKARDDRNLVEFLVLDFKDAFKQ